MPSPSITAENGTAATLAGRERVDLGVQTLNNRDHGLIYSGGDLLIGGALADNGAASGRREPSTTTARRLSPRVI